MKPRHLVQLLQAPRLANNFRCPLFCFFLFLGRYMSLFFSFFSFPEYYVSLPFPLCMESMSYVSLPVVVFLPCDDGLYFDTGIRLYENSIKSKQMWEKKNRADRFTCHRCKRLSPLLGVGLFFGRNRWRRRVLQRVLDGIAHSSPVRQGTVLVYSIRYCLSTVQTESNLLFLSPFRLR